jgi:hypothetical protein
MLPETDQEYSSMERNPQQDQGGGRDRQPGKDQPDVHSDPRRTREQHDDDRDNQRPTREDIRQDDTPKAE